MVVGGGAVGHHVAVPVDAGVGALVGEAFGDGRGAFVAVTGAVAAAVALGVEVLVEGAAVVAPVTDVVVGSVASIQRPGPLEAQVAFCGQT